MTRSRGTLSPEVRALLDEERAIPAQPAAVRARALARARAALAAGLTAPAALPSRRPVQARWAAAAVLVCIASAAAVVAAYGIHAHVARVLAGAPAPAAAPPPPVPAPIVVVPPPVDAPAVVTTTDDEAPPARAHLPWPPRLSLAQALRAELRLLRPARAAVAREDYAAALPPIAEHARRFKDGRLAEEREALRVKALVGLGRTEDARRAATAFRTRFPHSVLLPAVGQMSAARP